MSPLNSSVSFHLLKPRLSSPYQEDSTDGKEWRGAMWMESPCIYLPESGSRKKLELQLTNVPTIWTIQAVSIRTKFRLL